MNSEGRKRKANDQIPTVQQDQYLPENTAVLVERKDGANNDDEGRKDELLLEEGFSPSQFDVIWSRGKQVKDHPGNTFFHSLIEKAASRYGSAEGKLAKSHIVSEIIDSARKNSPNGGFVEKDKERWFRVDGLVTRERVSQMLRNKLHNQYRSSASSKRQRKDDQNAKMVREIQVLVNSSPFFSQQMNNLSTILQLYGSQLSDQQMEILMTQVNSDVLSHLKADGALLQMSTRLHDRG